MQLLYLFFFYRCLLGSLTFLSEASMWYFLQLVTQIAYSFFLSTWQMFWKYRSDGGRVIW
jgi:hypothetical protein